MVVRFSALRTGHFLTPGDAPGTHFCQRLSRPQGHSAVGRILCQWKNALTLAGIEPATFPFVAQYLNHCATAVRLYSGVRPVVQAANTTLHYCICRLCVSQFVMCPVIAAVNYFHAACSLRSSGAFAKLRRATIGFVMSVCPSVRLSAWYNSSPSGRIFMTFDIWGFFFSKHLSIKLKSH